METRNLLLTLCLTIMALLSSCAGDQDAPQEIAEVPNVEYDTIKLNDLEVRSTRTYQEMGHHLDLLCHFLKGGRLIDTLSVKMLGDATVERVDQLVKISVKQRCNAWNAFELYLEMREEGLNNLLSIVSGYTHPALADEINNYHATVQMKKGITHIIEEGYNYDSLLSRDTTTLHYDSTRNQYYTSRKPFSDFYVREESNDSIPFKDSLQIQLRWCSYVRIGNEWYYKKEEWGPSCFYPLP